MYAIALLTELSNSAMTANLYTTLIVIIGAETELRFWPVTVIATPPLQRDTYKCKSYTYVILHNSFVSFSHNIFEGCMLECIGIHDIVVPGEPSYKYKRKYYTN